MNRLIHKVAIVTGAATGIGEAVARRFAAEGAQVVLADFNVAQAQAAAAEINSGGHGERKAIACQVDVSREEDVRQLIGRTLEQFGTIDVLVNAAGILGAGDVMGTTLDSWNRVLSVNLTGTFLCMKAALPTMIAKQSGSIVNFSSSTGAYHATANFAAYITSKGGIASLTRSAAVDYAKHSIRINAVCPGPTNTQILADVSGEQLRQLQGSIPLGRVAERTEIAGTVLFLASDEASFITGAMISVDGGQTVAV